MANDHVKRWIEAWNKHDLQTVLSMYSEEIEFSSPKIKAVFPERTISKITNRKDLKEYWSKALKKYPKLNFVLKESKFHNNVCLIEYYAVLDGRTRTSVIEKFEMQNGLVIKSSVFYGAEEQSH
jgi:SnoaL-like domain